MAIRNPRERGTRRQIKNRLGDDFQEFRGMDLESDPGKIKRNAFRHLENVDLRGEIRERFGAKRLNLDTLEGCHQFLADFQPTAHRLFMTFIGLTGVSGTGRSLCWFDPDFSNQVQRMLNMPWATESAVLGTYGGDLYLGVDQFLKKLNLLQPISGQDPLLLSGQSQDTVVATLLGYTVRALCEFDAKLFIGAENIDDPTDSAIFTWDGTTLTLDTDGIEPPTYMWKFRDHLIIGFAAAADTLTQRDLAGVYTDVVHTGVIATSDMVTHRDKLYIADGAENVWQYDGTTLAVFLTITGAEINSLASFGGFLYYIYTSSGDEGIVGRDWVEYGYSDPTYHNLTDDNPTIAEGTILRAYRQKLYAVTSPINITSMLVFR